MEGGGRSPYMLAGGREWVGEGRMGEEIGSRGEGSTLNKGGEVRDVGRTKSSHPSLFNASWGATSGMFVKRAFEIYSVSSSSLYLEIACLKHL